MESQKGLPCGSLEGMRITNFADILFISYHVTDHPISLFEFYYLQEPSSASLFYILSYASSLTYVLHLFSSTSLTKSKVTTKSVQL